MFIASYDIFTYSENHKNIYRIAYWYLHCIQWSIGTLSLFIFLKKILELNAYIICIIGHVSLWQSKWNLANLQITFFMLKREYFQIFLPLASDNYKL